MEDHMPERRGSSRVAVSVAAVIKGKDDIVVGLVENISMGGFYMHPQHKIALQAGEAVAIDIYLNESGQSHAILKLHAHTVWVNERGIGVQFGSMTSADQTWLQAIINVAEGSSSDDEALLEFQLSF
jgi:hypothetical protein